MIATPHPIGRYDIALHPVHRKSLKPLCIRSASAVLHPVHPVPPKLLISLCIRLHPVCIRSVPHTPYTLAPSFGRAAFVMKGKFVSAKARVIPPPEPLMEQPDTSPAVRIPPLRPDWTLPPLRADRPIVPIEGPWRVSSGFGPSRVVEERPSGVTAPRKHPTPPVREFTPSSEILALARQNSMLELHL